MANEIQTSFIPKDGSSSRRSYRGNTMGLFTFIALLIFAVSLLTFAGAYGYQYFLSEQINRPCSADDQRSCGLLASLEIEKKSLRIDMIERYVSLSRKMNLAQDLINKHRALSMFFTALEESTLQSIQFTKLDFTADSFVLDGRTTSYEDIAVQAKVFSEDQRFKSARFSDFGVDKENRITFKVNLEADSSLLVYRPTGQ